MLAKPDPVRVPGQHMPCRIVIWLCVKGFTYRRGIGIDAGILGLAVSV